MTLDRDYAARYIAHHERSAPNRPLPQPEALRGPRAPFRDSERPRKGGRPRGPRGSRRRGHGRGHHGEDPFPRPRVRTHTRRRLGRHVDPAPSRGERRGRDRLGRPLAPIPRRIEDARQDVEKIVGGLVEKGRLTWEEGTRLREDVGLVFRESLSDVVGSVRDIASRLTPGTQPGLAKEIDDLKTRLAQLESLANSAFPPKSPNEPLPRRAAAPARKHPENNRYKK